MRHLRACPITNCVAPALFMHLSFFPRRTLLGSSLIKLFSRALVPPWLIYEQPASLHERGYAYYGDHSSFRPSSGYRGLPGCSRRAGVGAAPGPCPKAPGGRPLLRPRGGRHRVAADGSGARRGAELSGGVGPYRRYEGNPSRGRGAHAGRAGAICRRARPDFEAGGRQKDARCGSQGGTARRSVGCSSVWGGGGSRFTYLFGLRNTWAHRLMVMSLTAVIALVLSTIGVMEHPFSGGARLESDAFELILERFETSKLSDL